MFLPIAGLDAYPKFILYWQSYSTDFNRTLLFQKRTKNQLQVKLIDVLTTCIFRQYLQTDNQKGSFENISFTTLLVINIGNITAKRIARTLYFTYLIKMEACESVLRAKSAPELLSDSKNVRFLSEYFVLERLSLKNDWKSNCRYF